MKKTEWTVESFIAEYGAGHVEHENAGTEVDTLLEAVPAQLNEFEAGTKAATKAYIIGAMLLEYEDVAEPRF